MSGRGNFLSGRPEVVGTPAEISASIELSPAPTAPPAIQPAGTVRQASDGNSSSASPNQRPPTSKSWSLLRMSSTPSLSSFYSTVPRAFRYAARSKRSIYKNLLKILGVFCGIGALTVAWLTLRSPVNPSDVDIQSLAALNRTADGQMALHEVLQANLNKIQEELRNEREQLDVYRGLLEQAKDEVDLHAWTASRQFIKECIDYQENHNMTSGRCSKAIMEWDHPPTYPSHTSLHEAVRRQPLKPSSDLFNQQRKPTAERQSGHLAPAQSIEPLGKSAPNNTSHDASLPSPPAEARLLYPGFPTSDQHQYIDLSQEHWMARFVAYFLPSLFLIFLARLVRRRLSTMQVPSWDSEEPKSHSKSYTEPEPVVLRTTAIPDRKPAEIRNRKLSSRESVQRDIWTAAYSGNVTALISFREEGLFPNVNLTSTVLGTPLQTACQGGNLEAVSLLLQWDANPRILGGRFRSCLVAAAVSGNLDIVRLMLDLSVPVNKYNPVAGSVLHAACERGSQEMVEFLIVNGAEIDALGGTYGSPLQAACFQGNQRVVSVLLNHGAIINARGGQYGSPLHAAAAKGHIEVAKLLVENGIELNFETATSGSALQLACKNDHTNLAAYLITHGASIDVLDQENHTPLHHAARVGDTYLANITLTRGVAIDAADAHGYTALYYAAANGHRVVTALLLRHGADPSKSDTYGSQPLVRAAEMEYLDIAGLLLQAGVDVDAKDLAGKTALHYSFDNDDIKIMELLLEAGASIDDQADDGKTPLHRAVEVASFQNVEILVRRGADINIEDNDQATPLLASLMRDCKKASHTELYRTALYLLQQRDIDVNSSNSAAFQEAVALDETEIVDEMLAKNANINCQGWKYGGIAQAAVCSGSTNLLRRMLDLGADANILGGEFSTALQAAAYCGNMAMVELLLEHGAKVNTRGGRFDYALSAARNGIARAEVKVEMMHLLERLGAEEGNAPSKHEKEIWTLTPSGWAWLPAKTFDVA